VFLGFDPEAQHDYGMEGEAYAKLLKNVQQTIKLYKLDVISRSSGISSRYLRKIRAGTANVSVEILKFDRWYYSGCRPLTLSKHAGAAITRMGACGTRTDRDSELAYRLATDPQTWLRYLPARGR